MPLLAASDPSALGLESLTLKDDVERLQYIIDSNEAITLELAAADCRGGRGGCCMVCVQVQD